MSSSIAHHMTLCGIVFHVTCSSLADQMAQPLSPWIRFSPPTPTQLCTCSRVLGCATTPSFQRSAGNTNSGHRLALQSRCPLIHIPSPFMPANIILTRSLSCRSQVSSLHSSLQPLLDLRSKAISSTTAFEIHSPILMCLEAVLFCPETITGVIYRHTHIHHMFLVYSFKYSTLVKQLVFWSIWSSV